MLKREFTLLLFVLFLQPLISCLFPFLVIIFLCLQSKIPSSPTIAFCSLKIFFINDKLLRSHINLPLHLKFTKKIQSFKLKLCRYVSILLCNLRFFKYTSCGLLRSYPKLLPIWLLFSSLHVSTSLQSWMLMTDSTGAPNFTKHRVLFNGKLSYNQINILLSWTLESKFSSC